MCGRYSLRRPALVAKLVYQDGFEEFSEIRITPQWSYRPGTAVPVIRHNAEKKRTVSEVHWGLIPYWSRGVPKIQPINAKSEEVAGKPYFREPFRRRRCLFPMDGFFEPKGPKTLKKRQPYFFQRPDGGPFAVAGLWDRFSPEGAEAVDTCTLLTTGPNGVMAPIHDRMPVVVLPEDYDRWLDRDVPGEAVAGMLKPAPDDFLVTWQVRDMENDPETNRGVREGASEP